MSKRLPSYCARPRSDHSSWCWRLLRGQSARCSLSLFAVRILFLVLVLGIPSLGYAAPDDDPFGEPSGTRVVPSQTGPELGLSIGLATPRGAFEEDRVLRERVAAVVPLEVDAGYRLAPDWLIGVYGQYGVGISSSTSLASCASCVHTWLRYGVRGQYSVARTDSLHAWVGLGTGPFSFDTVVEDSNIGQNHSGWELFYLQLGSAWRPTPGLELGPVVSFSYATIDEREATCYRVNKDLCPRTSAVSLSDAGPVYWSTTSLRIVFLP